MRTMGRHPADHDDLRGAAQSRDHGIARVLVLGGSTDGFSVAEAIHAAGHDVVTSFAGRTKTRRDPVGRFRVGGFGGVEGLRAYLVAENIDLVIDATHPFAAQISANAAAACEAEGVAAIHLVRTPWRPGPDDDWRMAATLDEAAAMTPVTPGRCFLTVGRMKIAPFAARGDLSYLIRTVDPLDEPFAHERTLHVLDRGPFSLEGERALFARYAIDCVVTANSGGSGAQAKLEVARELGLPVVVVDRPTPPPGVVVATVAEAVARAGELLRSKKLA